LVQLVRAGQVLGSAQVNAQSPDSWRTLRLSAMGNLLRVSVDGTEVILAFEPSPLPAGSLTLRGTGLDAAGLTVDDVQVWLAASALPATNTPEPTATVAPTATATPVTLPLVYSTTFDAFDGTDWNADGWQVVPTAEGSVFMTTFDYSEVSSPNLIAADSAAQVRFQVTQGAMMMRLRYSEFGVYSALAFADGQIQLLRNLDLVASAQVPALGGSWNRLYLSAIGDLVTIQLNDVTVITFQDPQSLPEGSFGVATWNTQSATSFIDDLHYWAAEAPTTAMMSMVAGMEAEAQMAFSAAPMMAVTPMSLPTFQLGPNQAWTYSLSNSIGSWAQGNSSEYVEYVHASRQLPILNLNDYMANSLSIGHTYWAPNGELLAFHCSHRPPRSYVAVSDICIGRVETSGQLRLLAAIQLVPQVTKGEE
jgi:hypothetical protein